MIAGTGVGLHLNPIMGYRLTYLSARQRMYLHFPGSLCPYLSSNSSGGKEGS